MVEAVHAHQSAKLGPAINNQESLTEPYFLILIIKIVEQGDPGGAFQAL